MDGEDDGDMIWDGAQGEMEGHRFYDWTYLQVADAMKANLGLRKWKGRTVERGQEELTQSLQ